MKKISILLILLTTCIVTNNTYTQDKNGIYIIVSAHKKRVSYDNNYNVLRYAFFDEMFKDSVQVFRMFAPSYKIPIMKFWHFYSLKPKVDEISVNPNDQHKTFFKDSSFLNTVDCLYWDDVKDMKSKDAKEYIGPLLFHNGTYPQKTIYIVDLAEKHPNGKIKIYQVEDMVKDWSVGPHFEGEYERSKYMRTVKEKIDKLREQRKTKPFKK
ncbi:MAG: hypothetical protein IJE52_04390 [Bacteroidales bacterium]|nr:hypothetical protein [Bacteroidales bacterium]MBR2478300.1 hypothetical protein [Bacteroidales bacterium]